MAVSPIGNLTIVNQNTQIGAIQHANAQTRPDFQSMVALQELEDRQKEISEVRSTEETDLVDEDGHNERDKEEEQKNNQELEEELLADYKEREEEEEGHTLNVLV